MSVNAGRWSWMGRYLTVIVVLIILAAALGSMDLFAKTSLGSLSAAKIVQFLGYGASLVIFWLLGQRATMVMQQEEGKWSFMRHLLLPVVSLIVVALAYTVLLLVLKPMLSATLLNLYNWLFIIAILACAGWLVMAVLNQSAPLTALFTQQGDAVSKTCAACGEVSAEGDKFCHQCGKSLS